MLTSADRAAMARALVHDLTRAPETKRAPLALSAVDQAGVFEGYASLFGVADLGRDVVERGAFADSLRKRGAASVKMLWQHDPAEPIGAWLSIGEDARGLKVTGRLNLAVARAREILSLMREGAVDGLSIGFRTQRATQDRKTGLRRLQKVDLWEISLVTFPMLPQARVTAVKRTNVARDVPRIRPLAAALARAKWAYAAGRLEAKFLSVATQLEQRYAPDQPRDDLGRWTSDGSQGDLIAGLVINICVAVGIARSTDDYGNLSWKVDFECRDGRIIVKSGTGSDIPGLIIDPAQ